MHILRISIAAVLTLGLFQVAYAEPPPGVGGLEVEINEEGELIVSWDKVESDDIASYNVYYSSKSILENAGEYDDFETTDGPKSRYTFEEIPAGDTLYFSVLALNTANEEGTFFQEEISISPSSADRNPVPEAPVTDPVPLDEEPEAPQPPQQPLVAPELPPVAPSDPAAQASQEVLDQQATNPGDDVDRFDGKLHLVSAEATSPTEIVLEFSHWITIEPSKAPDAFKIVKSDDTPLQIKRLVTKGEKATVITDTQERGVVYNVKLSEPLAGHKGEPLSKDNRSSLVVGHSDGKEPVPLKEPIPNDPQSILNPQDVKGFTLEAKQEGQFFTVTARWEESEISGGLAGYILRQSVDGGLNFSPAENVPAGVAGVDIGGVFPGNFGMSIQTVNQQQNTSEGIFKSLILQPNGTVLQGAVMSGNLPPAQPNVPNGQPQIPQVPQQPQGNVPPQVPNNRPPAPVVPPRRPLPYTGPAAGMVLVSLVGAVAGWKRVGLGNRG